MESKVKRREEKEQEDEQARMNKGGDKRGRGKEAVEPF